MIRDVDRITHLLTAIADAKESIAGLTKDQFLESKDKRVAAERYILIVGEASHMVSNELKTKHPEIPCVGRKFTPCGISSPMNT